MTQMTPIERLQEQTKRHAQLRDRRTRAEASLEANQEALTRHEAHCQETYKSTDPTVILAQADKADAEDLEKLNQHSEALDVLEAGLKEFEEQARALASGEASR